MENNQSFTQLLKDELSHIPFNDEVKRAILSSFIKINGSLLIKSKQTNIVLKTENANIAKFIHNSISSLYGLPIRFSYSKIMNFKTRTIYNMYIEKEADSILEDLEINFLENKISKNIIYNDEMIAGYLCGAFLASGSVNSPKSSNYHLEIALNEDNYARWFTKLFLKYKGGQFNAKIIKRRNQNIVYLKRADQIVDFLILIGATSGALEFEDIRMEREFINIGNRLSNLDSANYNKTTKAAKNQIEDIKLIDKIIGIDNIENIKIKNLMILRLEFEDASLNELAKKMSDKLNATISKSNISHLFRAIEKDAKRYKGNK